MNNQNSDRGAFITLEGGEGTGKSTLLKSLVTALSARGRHVIATREPGGSPLAEHVRALVLHPPDDTRWSALSAALLVNAARRNHLETLIWPALEAGKTVICDRFADSTRVYQGYCGGADLGVLNDMETAVMAHRAPDLTLILDVPVSVTKSRRQSRGVTDDFEARPDAFHEEVRRAFQIIASEEPDRCVIIDASHSECEVFDRALDVITRRIG